jgi:hypothetical protein
MSFFKKLPAEVSETIYTQSSNNLQTNNLYSAATLFLFKPCVCVCVCVCVDMDAQECSVCRMRRRRATWKAWRQRPQVHLAAPTCTHQLELASIGPPQRELHLPPQVADCLFNSMPWCVLNMLMRQHPQGSRALLRPLSSLSLSSESGQPFCTLSLCCVCVCAL